MRPPPDSVTTAVNSNGSRPRSSMSACTSGKGAATPGCNGGLIHGRTLEQPDAPSTKANQAHAHPAIHRRIIPLS